MEEGSQAHAGEHRPSTPPAQVIHETEEATPVAPQVNSSSTNEHGSDSPDNADQVEDLDEPLGPFDWAELDRKFNEEMQLLTDEEGMIQQEFVKLMNVSDV